MKTSCDLGLYSNQYDDTVIFLFGLIQNVWGNWLEIGRCWIWCSPVKTIRIGMFNTC